MGKRGTLERASLLHLLEKYMIDFVKKDYGVVRSTMKREQKAQRIFGQATEAQKEKSGTLLVNSGAYPLLIRNTPLHSTGKKVKHEIGTANGYATAKKQIKRTMNAPTGPKGP